MEVEALTAYEEVDMTKCRKISLPVKVPSGAQPGGILQFRVKALSGHTLQFYLHPNLLIKDGAIVAEVRCSIAVPCHIDEVSVHAYDIKTFCPATQSFEEIMSFFHVPSLSKLPSQRKLPPGFNLPVNHGRSPSGMPIVVIRTPPRQRADNPHDTCKIAATTLLVEAGGVPQMGSWLRPPEPECSYEEWEVCVCSSVIDIRVCAAQPKRSHSDQCRSHPLAGAACASSPRPRAATFQDGPSSREPPPTHCLSPN
jgi:hypothetical protein